MTSKPGKQIITIHKLSNVLRSKGNQTMNFIAWEKFFLEKLYKKCRGEAIARHFFKKIEHISGSNL